MKQGNRMFTSVMLTLAGLTAIGTDVGGGKALAEGNQEVADRLNRDGDRAANRGDVSGERAAREAAREVERSTPERATEIERGYDRGDH